MKVHLFGAASSPGCVNFGLRRAADDGEDEFGTDAAEFIRKEFYVDDCVKSVSTVKDAVTLIKANGYFAGVKMTVAKCIILNNYVAV